MTSVSMVTTLTRSNPNWKANCAHRKCLVSASPFSVDKALTAIFEIKLLLQDMQNAWSGMVI